MAMKGEEIVLFTINIFYLSAFMYQSHTLTDVFAAETKSRALELV